MISAISHEHNESITDPEPNNAWTDWGSNVGGEIGDKCNDDAWQNPSLFGASGDPYNQTINGHHYFLQREWSNQTHQCLQSFMSNGTAIAGSFTDATVGTQESFTASAFSSLSGSIQYVWQFNDGPGQTATQETTSPNISHTFPTTGVYTVALTVMAADGTSYGTTHPVYVGGTAPAASFTPGGGLEGSPIAFSASALPQTPGATISNYSWNFGDGTTGSGQSTSHAFPHPGPFTVALVAMDNYGQLSPTVTRTVIVADESPAVSFTAPSGAEGRAINFSVSASDPDGSITSVRWNFGRWALGHWREHATHLRPRPYNVSVTVTDSGGQSAGVAHRVTIGPGLCLVPELKGDSLNKARKALSSAHCALGRASRPRSPAGARANIGSGCS